MPTYLPARGGVAFSEAYAEAIATARQDRAILQTLELRHSGFRDDAGAPYAIRIVDDHADLHATLESTAPLDAGAEVLFVALPVQVGGPDETDGAEAPAVTLAIDGVSGHVVGQLDRAVQTLEPVQVTVRYYASDDTSGPAMLPVLTMTLRDVEVGETRITARAAFWDPANRGFPRREYTPAEYPGLSA